MHWITAVLVIFGGLPASGNCRPAPVVQLPWNIAMLTALNKCRNQAAPYSCDAYRNNALPSRWPGDPRLRSCALLDEVAVAAPLLGQTGEIDADSGKSLLSPVPPLK